jgi:hypothetical protein
MNRITVSQPMVGAASLALGLRIGLAQPPRAAPLVFSLCAFAIAALCGWELVIMRADTIAAAAALIVGINGALRLSSDGKWYLPFEADIADGSKNWQLDAILGAGYHFHWGDVTPAVCNITYQKSGDVFLQKVRMTGPLIGAISLVKGKRYRSPMPRFERDRVVK